MSLTDPSVSSTHGPMTGAQATGNGTQDRSLDTSQYSPLVGSTHGTSRSLGHPGTSTRSLGQSVSQ